ncbi:unnamed protein product [Arctia plantaginis]|uniref:Uncharacterized protein n=1 Tax=Arctia plantaginis TaxID=874455 RepID=A0A8S0ZK61_ARCPL|nr:unnamed protein product [Arctia plantaginis]
MGVLVVSIFVVPLCNNQKRNIFNSRIKSDSKETPANTIQQKSQNLFVFPRKIRKLVTVITNLDVVTEPMFRSHQMMSEESKLLTTTEYTLKCQVKVKRSNNIIEEENVDSTVSGYKFTWRDTRLTDNSVYKNIHS